jgi:AcrR family transcriptional regulator
MSGIGARSLDAEDKRALLLDSAERTFCRLGYANTSVGALAQDAGVSRPTVYAYYPSKDDVFQALAERVRDEFLAMQERAAGPTPAATGLGALERYFETCIEHRGMLTLIAHQALADPAIRRLHDDIHGRANRRHTRFLHRLIDNGEIAPDIAPEAISEAITGVTMRFADLAAADPARAAELRTQLLRIYLTLTGLRGNPDRPAAVSKSPP